MIIIKEENLPKLEDYGLVPKYDENNGAVNKYVSNNGFIEVYTTDKYFGVHQNPYIWRLNVSMYGREDSLLDDLFDIMNSGLFIRVDSLKELKEVLKPDEEEPVEEEQPSEEEPVEPAEPGEEPTE